MVAVLVVVALVAAGLWAAVCLEGHLDAGAEAARPPVRRPACGRAARGPGAGHSPVARSVRCRSRYQAVRPARDRQPGRVSAAASHGVPGNRPGPAAVARHRWVRPSGPS